MIIIIICCIYQSLIIVIARRYFSVDIYNNFPTDTVLILRYFSRHLGWNAVGTHYFTVNTAMQTLFLHRRSYFRTATRKASFRRKPRSQIARF